MLFEQLFSYVKSGEMLDLLKNYGRYKRDFDTESLQDKLKE